MADEITLHEGAVSGGLQIRTMDDLSRVSKMLAQSRFFTDAIDAAQCGVKVLAGTEMGFGAFASMTGIHIIKGKPSIGANLMAAAVKRHPNYNYRVLEHTPEVCRIAFYERWDGKLEQVGESTFTLADAKKAGTQNLDKYARNMLFARAMSNGVKWYCPDVFDSPVYTPEELGAAVDEEGNYIDVEVVQPNGNSQPPVKPAKVTSPLEAEAKTLVKEAMDEGLTVERIREICTANNLPAAAADFSTRDQVFTLAQLLQDEIAAIYEAQAA
jgi:hypothetical protein